MLPLIRIVLITNALDVAVNALIKFSNAKLNSKEIERIMWIKANIDEAVKAQADFNAVISKDPEYVSTIQKLKNTSKFSLRRFQLSKKALRIADNNPEIAKAYEKYSEVEERHTFLCMMLRKGITPDQLFKSMTQPI